MRSGVAVVVALCALQSAEGFTARGWPVSQWRPTQQRLREGIPAASGKRAKDDVGTVSELYSPAAQAVAEVADAPEVQLGTVSELYPPATSSEADAPPKVKPGKGFAKKATASKQRPSAQKQASASVAAKTVAKKTAAKKAVKAVVEEPVEAVVEEPVKAVTKKAVTKKAVAKKAVSKKAAVEEPVKAAVKEPVKAVAEEPAKAVVEKPAKAVVEEPAKAVVKEPVKAVVEEPAKAVVEKPVKAVVKEPTKAVVEKPVKAVVKEPVKAVVEEPVKASASAAETEEADQSGLEMKQMLDLVSEVSQASTASNDERVRLASVRDRLQQSVELKHQVEGIFTEELETLTAKLEVEAAAETVRTADIVALMEKFRSGVVQKKEATSKDAQLLQQMEETILLVKEDSIKSTMQMAIDDKVRLCQIEEELLTKMQECLSQLEQELEDTKNREAQIRSAKANLPDIADVEAVRRYSWEDIVELREMLVNSADAAAEREKAIASITADFAAAMNRRKEVLVGEVVPREEATSVDYPRASAVNDVPPPPPPPSSTHSSQDLAREAAESFQDTTVAMVEVAKSAIAVGVIFASSEETSNAVSALGTTGSELHRALSGLRSAVQVASNEWNNVLEKTVDAEFDRSKRREAEAQGSSRGNWFRRAYEAVVSSEDAQHHLEESRKAFASAASSFGQATKGFYSSARETVSLASGDTKIVGALEGAKDATGRTTRVLSTLATKIGDGARN